MKELLIVAGEASGDMHGAALVREAIAINPELRFVGLGGPKMRAAGAEIVFDPLAHSSTGVTDFFASVPKLYPYLGRLERLAEERGIRTVVLIDYPEFNLRLAKRLKKAGLTVIYYISPQFWAWREWRVKTVRRYVDHLLVLFDFEVDFYRKHDIQAHFVGHPLVDLLAETRPDPAFRASLGIPENHRLIGLLPGSRKREIKWLYPVMVEAAKQLKQGDPNLSFVLGKAPSAPIPEAAEALAAELPVLEAVGRAHELMANADLLLVASGTATLECAVFATPMVVAYITSAISYHLCKPLRKSAFIALPNILANKQIVPELIQYEATPERIVEEARTLLTPERQADLRCQLEAVRDRLGPGGASRQAAERLVKILAEGPDN